MASSTNSHDSSTSWSARAFSRVYSCRVRIVALRWVCTTARTSTPGVHSASASLIASSSRGRSVRLIGVANHAARSLRPAAVIS